MADQKISALNELTTWATDDEIAIVDTDLTETKRMTATNVKANVFSTFINLNRVDLTIDVAGAVIATTSFARVDTNGGGAADDLDTINGGDTGDILVLMQANNARVVTVKDGTGNIELAGGADFALTNIRSTILLINRAGTWVEISRSLN